MMRIAEISVHGCPLRPLGSKDAGGMNVYVRQLSQELGRIGVKVDIFTRWHDPKEPEVMMIGEQARLIHIEAGEQEDVPNTDIHRCLPQFLCNLHRFSEREEVTYDLIHSHYWLSAWVVGQLKAQLGIPHVATFHTLGAVKNRARPDEMEPVLRLDVERKAIAAADRVIAFTAEERDDLIGIYGAHPDMVSIIPCGIDLGLFHPMDRWKARSELGLDDSRVLLFAGRIEPIKGIDILLRAVALLTDGGGVRLLVVGGDAASAHEVARLCALAGGLGIGDKVTFLGAVEHGRMPLFYSAADLCVVPSYHESFGLVALEALACGTPVVASSVGGLATIIKDGETGYLVDGLSHEAFARRLELLLGDEELRRRMGDAAHLSAAKYAWPIVAGQVLMVYEELTGDYPSFIP
ncbi:MAG: glycosyltransferase [Dehalococcoidia bacterium]